MATVEEMLAYGRKKLGPADLRAPLPPETAAFNAARLPSSLAGFLEDEGLARYRDGLLQTIPGDRWQGVLQQVLRGDPDLHGSESALFALSGFGQLFGWNARHGAFTVMTLPNRFLCAGLFTPTTLPPEVAALMPFVAMYGNLHELFDRDGDRMFRPLVAAHGALPPGRIFAPRLHPALGGAMEIGNFRPAEAMAAVALILQAEPIVLRGDTGRGMQDIRRIGPQE